MKKRLDRRKWDARLNPIRLAGYRNPPTEAELLSARLAEAQAIGSLADGIGTTHDAGVMLLMLRIAGAMATAGVGGEALPALRAATEAMGAVKQTGRGLWLASADLVTLREALAWHEAQRLAASGADYTRAIVRATTHRNRFDTSQ